MIVTLKDGSKKEYAEAKSVIDIAYDISEGLARAACAGEVNGEVVDLRTVIDSDCELNILTAKDEKGLAVLRHTASHVLAQAVQTLFPDAKVAIGPSIDTGFYYDFDCPPFSRDDLDAIEKEMKKIIKKGAKIERFTKSREDAMRIYSATDVGQKRKMNQDYVFATADPVGNLPNLFVVADGMGGHNAGDYASSHAVTSMVEEIRQDADFNPVKVIRHAIECVNTEILTQAQQDEKLRGMGTTIVAATIVGHYAYVANVGDSRLYVIGEKIQQITRDHSLVQEMVRMGELDPEQARKHPKKNIITRALGAEKTVDIDFFDLKLEPGDVVLMCSDGLSNMVEDSQLREIISDTSTDLDEKGRILIREANRNGGKDNIAIVLVEPFADEVKAC